jgi:lipopolysaccharide transport system ATP-binding protein
MHSIEVDNLSKRYVINHQTKKRARSLRELLALPFKSAPERAAPVDLQPAQESFWALKDISFSVGDGERIAIIGGNGAGKSTLLKILSRITEPTEGRVTIRGKVSSLLEVGTGFHPELSGRENIFLNGAILGMRRSEIAAKFDQIVAFSGVEKFIDTPVKHYSSGMYVRLAFSVSAWLDPDILIVDEVLSVGDQAFQRRCAERMKELTGAGRTVLFVSHSMQAVKAMCEKALFLEKGRAVSFESVEDAANQYLRSIEPDEGAGWHKDRFDPSTDVVNQYGFSKDHLLCIGAAIMDDRGTPTSTLDIRATHKIVVQYEILNDLPADAVPNFHFFDEFGGRVCVSYPESPSPRLSGNYSVECELPPFVFNTGRYSVMLVMSTFPGGLEYLHHFSYEAALRFEVTEPDWCDMRRHGWRGAIPGVTRPRLNWVYLR